MSHDLRTPLTAIVGFAELARGRVADDDPRLADFLERIEVNARQMAAQIDGLLALSRLQRSDEADEEVDLEALLGEVLDRVEPPATAQLRIETSPVVDAPPEMIRGLFRRLIDNCVDHAGRADVIVTVAVTRSAEGGVAVVVEDDGPGIPAESVAKVLAPFGRLDDDSDSPRAGMGLTLCERAARVLGGQLEIGEGSGGGCRVAVTFPRHRTPDEG